MRARETTMKPKEDDNLKLIFSIVLAIAFAAYLSNTHADQTTAATIENVESPLHVPQ